MPHGTLINCVWHNLHMPEIKNRLFDQGHFIVYILYGLLGGGLFFIPIWIFLNPGRLLSKLDCVPGFDHFHLCDNDVQHQTFQEKAGV